MSSSIQKHMEEAMQPDGADLEYVYLGPSKGMSNSSPVSPSHSPMYIAAYSMHPGTTFIQEDSSPYAPVDDWSVEPYPMAPGAFVSRTRRPAIAGSPRVPRPKTAGMLPADLHMYMRPCYCTRIMFMVLHVPSLV